MGFANEYQGYRRLVLGKRAGSAPSGVIIEVIPKGGALSSAQLKQVFKMLYNAYQQGKAVALPGFTGFAACYSRKNYYLTGLYY